MRDFKRRDAVTDATGMQYTILLVAQDRLTG